jgi:hypothetical protein
MICSNGHYVSGDICKLCNEVLREKKAPVTKLKRVSDKRAKEEVEYTKLRKKFMLENKFCQAKLVGCSGKSIDIHHRGKRGVNYLNIETWISVCRNCHSKIHDVLSAKENRENNLII